jgi:hypothetical protein
MELTGADYNYFTNIDPAEVEAKFVAGVIAMWPSLLIAEPDMDGLGGAKLVLDLFLKR